MLFLLTPLREGRLVLRAKPFIPQQFLLTPLREGRRFQPLSCSDNIQFLLTPLREGRLQFSTSPS